MLFTHGEMNELVEADKVCLASAWMPQIGFSYIIIFLSDWRKQNDPISVIV